MTAYPKPTPKPYDNYLLFPNDEVFWMKKIEEEWYLKGAKPTFATKSMNSSIWNEPSTVGGMHPGVIMIYQMQINSPRGYFGVDAKTVTKDRTVTIDIRHPDRDIHYAYVREVLRIIHTSRKIGKCYLNGWDFVEINPVNERPGYQNYFHTTVDIRLVRMVCPLMGTGFGSD